MFWGFAVVFLQQICRRMTLFCCAGKKINGYFSRRYCLHASIDFKNKFCPVFLGIVTTSQNNSYHQELLKHLEFKFAGPWHWWQWWWSHIWPCHPVCWQGTFSRLRSWWWWCWWVVVMLMMVLVSISRLAKSSSLLTSDFFLMAITGLSSKSLRNQSTSSPGPTCK